FGRSPTERFRSSQAAKASANNHNSCEFLIHSIGARPGRLSILWQKEPDSCSQTPIFVWARWERRAERTLVAEPDYRELIHMFRSKQWRTNFLDSPPHHPLRGLPHGLRRLNDSYLSFRFFALLPRRH